MANLLIATTSQGKLKEYQQLFNSLPNKIISLNQLKLPVVISAPRETGKTFKQNAIIKALAYGQKTNLPTIADDTGLSIDCLDGFPGIRSARFANKFTDRVIDRTGSCHTYAIKKILTKLKSISQKNRTAKFTCVIALYLPSTKKIHTFSAIVRGFIAPKVIGRHGFGYDSIFLLPGLNKTFAQLTQSQKNKISHRTKATKKLIKFLAQFPINQTQNSQ